MKGLGVGPAPAGVLAGSQVPTAPNATDGGLIACTETVTLRTRSDVEGSKGRKVVSGGTERPDGRPSIAPDFISSPFDILLLCRSAGPQRHQTFGGSWLMTCAG